MSCVNIKSEEFKSTAKRLDLSSGTLEMIVHEFQNTVGNEGTFPTDEYIQSKLVGKSQNKSDTTCIFPHTAVIKLSKASILTPPNHSVFHCKLPFHHLL